MQVKTTKLRKVNYQYYLHTSYPKNKKKIGYEGKIEKLPDKKIYINVNHLEKGNYELNIINKNKLIIKTNIIINFGNGY